MVFTVHGQYTESNNDIIESIDSLVALKIWEKKETRPKVSDVDKTAPIKGFPDMFYEFRIATLDKSTPISLYYDEEVKKYIEIFTVTRKKEFEKIIGLGDLYFPIFEEYLDKYDLPFELKYLPVVESSLNPLAVSRSGAVGLWQFLYRAGELFDLEMNSYIDERRDIYKSTDAACRYLKYLFTIFNDWQLVLAAYNSGPGEIRDAIQKSGGKITFNDLKPYLPAQPLKYVPAFMAANYVMNYHGEHGIRPQTPLVDYQSIDTVYIKHPTTFAALSSHLEVEPNLLRFLNPAYKKDYIPVASAPESIIVPFQKVKDFVKSENSIYADSKNNSDYFSFLANAGSVKDKVKIIHTVKKGEYFHKIALKYNCTMEDIKVWNNLEGNMLYPDQKLEIWVEKSYLH
jgi:membrane-bound lytic murein transglycosylase D